MKRMALVGAAASVLVATMLTGSAQAATGGGCGAVSYNIQVCSTWVTGQGPANSTYVNAYATGTQLHPSLIYCASSTVMTSGTCSSHGLSTSVVSLTQQFSVQHTGLQGTWAWSSKPAHGIAYASTYILSPSVSAYVAGSLVYW